MEEKVIDSVPLDKSVVGGQRNRDIVQLAADLEAKYPDSGIVVVMAGNEGLGVVSNILCRGCTADLLRTAIQKFGDEHMVDQPPVGESEVVHIPPEQTPV